jgi:hypothetical protein
MLSFKFNLRYILDACVSDQYLFVETGSRLFGEIRFKYKPGLLMTKYSEVLQKKLKMLFNFSKTSLYEGSVF